MGGGASSFLLGSDKSSRTAEYEPSISYTLSKQEIEFREKLSNGVFLKYLSIYSKVINKHFLVVIWESIEEYLTMSDTEVTLDSLCLVLFPHQELFPMAAEFTDLCNDANENIGNCHVQERTILLVQIKNRCTQLLFEQIYVPFVETPEHADMCKCIEDIENGIKEKDFQHLNLLAHGAFGVVVQSRKVSSNELYAMKIQSKLQMIRQFRYDKDRVSRELEASVVLRHPYIAGLAYAFQTKFLAVLVFPVSACGDLRRSLGLCPEGRMSLARVIFYAAEICSALMYMHVHNVMYRDLKPANVLLNADGHIMLTDLGSLTGINL